MKKDQDMIKPEGLIQQIPQVSAQEVPESISKDFLKQYYTEKENAQKEGRQSMFLDLETIIKQENKSLEEHKVGNYAENYVENTIISSLTLQRKILIALNLFILLCISAVSIAIYLMTKNKSFEPFVISIDDYTGESYVVEPSNKEFLESKENLAKYFIKKYLVAKEGYNFATYNTYSAQVIRSLSSSNVFTQYLGYISNPENDLFKKYGEANATYIEIKSWSRLSNNKYLVRFNVNEMAQNMYSVSKVAILEIDYVPVGTDNMDINPVGFRVRSYSVSNDGNT